LSGEAGGTFSTSARREAIFPNIDREIATRERKFYLWVISHDPRA
jgi:hypothetical protein